MTFISINYQVAIVGIPRDVYLLVFLFNGVIGAGRKAFLRFFNFLLFAPLWFWPFTSPCNLYFLHVDFSIQFTQSRIGISRSAKIIEPSALPSAKTCSPV